MQRPFILLTLTSLLLGACGGDKNDSDSDTTGTTGATSTDATTAGTADPTTTDTTDSVGMSSTPTTGGADGSASVSTTVDSDPGTATDGSAGGMTTGSASDTAVDTGDDPELMQLCESFCAKNGECNRVDTDGCVAQCLEVLTAGDECAATSQELFTCMLGLTCEQLVALTDEDDPGPCGAQLEENEEACSGNACLAAFGVNEEETECSYILECPGDPALEYKCTAEICVCLEDGEEVAQCPGESGCRDVVGLTDGAMACCGF